MKIQIQRLCPTRLRGDAPPSAVSEDVLSGLHRDGGSTMPQAPRPLERGPPSPQRAAFTWRVVFHSKHLRHKKHRRSVRAGVRDTAALHLAAECCGLGGPRSSGLRAVFIPHAARRLKPEQRREPHNVPAENFILATCETDPIN